MYARTFGTNSGWSKFIRRKRYKWEDKMPNLTNGNLIGSIDNNFLLYESLEQIEQILTMTLMFTPLKLQVKAVFWLDRYQSSVSCHFLALYPLNSLHSVPNMFLYILILSSFHLFLSFTNFRECTLCYRHYGIHF